MIIEFNDDGNYFKYIDDTLYSSSLYEKKMDLVYGTDSVKVVSYEYSLKLEEMLKLVNDTLMLRDFYSHGYTKTFVKIR